jgi:hypothetical protein
VTGNDRPDRRSALVGIAGRAEELTGIRADAIPIDDLLTRQHPVILRGVLRDWPLVRHALRSPEEAMGYLATFCRGAPVTALVGSPGIKGRFHYTDKVDALNFRIERTTLEAFLERLLAHRDDPEPPGLYVGSTDVDVYLPGLRAENDLALDLAGRSISPPLISLWMGNATIASAHWDILNNMACCAVGRRRFTLFPPEQVENLYPGPLEPTPGGQVVSMVDFARPDLARFPRFAEAMRAGQVAELEPGDILFFPSLWWHHVEGLGSLNAMINFWWSEVPPFLDSPMDTLLHAILSLRDRPDTEKRSWRAMFDYYVFGPSDQPTVHLPPASRGLLAPLDDMRARQLRAMLLNRLNR